MVITTLNLIIDLQLSSIEAHNNLKTKIVKKEQQTLKQIVCLFVFKLMSVKGYKDSKNWAGLKLADAVKLYQRQWLVQICFGPKV